MKTGQNGIDLIKKFESLELEAYICPAGIPTIGYGHTLGVKLGDKINEAKAVEYLYSDLKQCEEGVNRLLPNCNQNQFDALVSFCFNLGVYRLASSTLLACIKRGDNRKDIENQFERWNKATIGGKLTILNGLTIRRRAEAALFFQP